MRFVRAVAALAQLGALRDAASADHIAVVDAIGRQVEVAAPAQRVVILFNYRWGERSRGSGGFCDRTTRRHCGTGASDSPITMLLSRCMMSGSAVCGSSIW
jgi:hypothetical protein